MGVVGERKREYFAKEINTPNTTHTHTHQHARVYTSVRKTSQWQQGGRTGSKENAWLPGNGLQEHVIARHAISTTAQPSPHANSSPSCLMLLFKYEQEYYAFSPL